LAKKNLSAIKRHRQSERRRRRNRAVKSALKTLIKKLNLSITNKDIEGAKTTLTGIIKALHKAASKGVIHKNTASRRISRLTKRVNELTPQGQARSA